MNIITEIMRYAPLLLRGALTTLGVWILSCCISLSIGCILGILSCNRLKKPMIGRFLRSYVIIMKGIPFYVQLLISYFVVPKLLGINLSAIVVATITLGLCSAAYVSEIIRAGMNAIPIGQWEACIVLGYGRWNTLWRIMIPQMLRNSLPSLIGEIDQELTSTAMFATIGVIELTKTAMNIVSRELNPLPIYLTIAAVYLTFSVLINWIGKQLEQRNNYGYR